MWRALAAVALLSLVGCNTWSRYYIDALGADVHRIPLLEPYYGNPVVVCTENMESSILRLQAAGYEPVGFSVFNDAEVIDVDGAVDHATQLSAAIVLVYTRHPFALCGGMSSPVGRRIESRFASAPVVSLDVLAPSENPTMNGESRIAGRITKFEDYDYVATFLARRRTLLGAVLSDLGDDDVYDLGARVDALVPRSPFDRAGLQLGDIIVYVDGVEMLDTWHVTKTVKEVEGSNVTIEVLRGGNRLDLTLAMPDSSEQKKR